MDARKLLLQCYADRAILDDRIAWLVSKLGKQRRSGTERRVKQRRKKLHWTQRPENRAKVQKLGAKMAAARKAKT